MLTVALIALALASTTSTGHDQVCLRKVSVTFTEVHLRFETERAIKDHILVMPPIDCKAGKFLAPRNLQEGISWLDLALPVEYKMSALKGPYLNTYKYGGFAVSAERDLGTFFARIWKLDEASFCKAIDPNDQKNQHSTCFMKILDAWRAGYQESSQPPSRT